MVLHPEPDTSLADWFTHQDLDWVQLCTSGPSGFEACARVFHAPADVDEHEAEDYEGDLPTALLAGLVRVLARHTGTPDDCFFGLWDGYGELPHAFMSLPRVRIPNRDYLLFRGNLDEAGLWLPEDERHPPEWPLNSPNLMWPADRAWFVATEIDQPWTAISGRTAAVRDVLADPRLDAQPFVPSPRPSYWRQ